MNKEMTENDALIANYIERERAMDWTKPCDEMVRLRALLEARGIAWRDTGWKRKNANHYLWRTVSYATHVTSDGFEVNVFEVSWGEFTYGASLGLLEVMTFDSEEAVGNCDAEAALAICQGAMNRHFETLAR